MKFKSLVTMVGLFGLSATGCGVKQADFVKPTSYYYERHDVDQVFRDHNGYRLIWDDSTGLVHERQYDSEHYYLNLKTPYPDSLDVEFKFLKDRIDKIVIIKDLNSKAQGYAQAVHYYIPKEYFPSGINGEQVPLYYVEVHIPKDQGLSPGNEAYGGKFQTNSPIHEIK